MSLSRSPNSANSGAPVDATLIVHIPRSFSSFPLPADQAQIGRGVMSNPVAIEGQGDSEHQDRHGDASHGTECVLEALILYPLYSAVRDGPRQDVLEAVDDQERLGRNGIVALDRICHADICNRRQTDGNAPGSDEDDDPRELICRAVTIHEQACGNEDAGKPVEQQPDLGLKHPV